MQFAIYAAYAGRLETTFLTDELASARAVLQGTALSPESPFSNAAAAAAAAAADADTEKQPSQMVPLPPVCSMQSSA